MSGPQSQAAVLVHYLIVLYAFETCPPPQQVPFYNALLTLAFLRCEHVYIGTS